MSTHENQIFIQRTTAALNALIRKQIDQAMNKAADEIQRIAPNSDLVHDTTKLTINAALHFLEYPDDSLETAIEASYDEDIGEVLSWIQSYEQPLVQKNATPGHMTDTDVVDAIALGLGTRPEWSGADELEWIADTIGMVRQHPGDQDADDSFLDDFIGDRRHY